MIIWIQALVLHSHVLALLGPPDDLDQTFIKPFFDIDCRDTWQCCQAADPDRGSLVLATNHEDVSHISGGPAIKFDCIDLEVDTDHRVGAVDRRRSYVYMCDEYATVRIDMRPHVYTSARPGSTPHSETHIDEIGWCRGLSVGRHVTPKRGQHIPPWCRNYFGLRRVRLDFGRTEDLTDGTIYPAAIPWATRVLGTRPSNPIRESGDTLADESTSSDEDLAPEELDYIDNWGNSDTLMSRRPRYGSERTHRGGVVHRPHDDDEELHETRFFRDFLDESRQ